MNQSFYDNAFSPSEQKLIKTTLLSNKAHGDGADEDDTEDNVFCLSLSEAENYFYFENWDERCGYSQNLMADGTPYAKAVNDGALKPYTIQEKDRDFIQKIGYSPDVIGKTHAEWWLRSSSDRKMKHVVSNCGGVGLWEDYALTSNGVRPALWINYGYKSGGSDDGSRELDYSSTVSETVAEEKVDPFIKEDLPEEDWMIAYKNHIENEENLTGGIFCTDSSANNYVPISFALYDIDADDVPELMVFSGSADGYDDPLTFVYRYANGIVEGVGDLPSISRVSLRYGEDLHFPGVFSDWSLDGESGTDYLYMTPDGWINTDQVVVCAEATNGDTVEVNRTSNDELYYYSQNDAIINLEFISIDDYKSLGWEGLLSMYHDRSVETAPNNDNSSDVEPKTTDMSGLSEKEWADIATKYAVANGEYAGSVVDVLFDDHEPGKVTIHLYDDMGTHTATSNWYFVDQATGRGTDLFEKEVDLSTVW